MTIHKVGGGSGKPHACLTLTEADTLRADLTHWQEVCYAHEAELQCLRAETARLRAALRDVLPHAWAAEYHDDWIGNGVRREACITAEAVLACREVKP